LKNADNTNIKKTAVIVKGGPGTGKSVIALHLLTYFLKQEKYHIMLQVPKPLLKHFGDVW
jgi:DNA helicase IV